MIDDFRFGEFTIRIDCDVLQADGGTRTAAITGSCVAVHDAFTWLVAQGHIARSPVRRRVAAVSVGVVDGALWLDLDYDLSDVMFITTANTLGGIPVPLQDRMEIIQLSGYTEFEKFNIAMKYLIPRQRKECGLEDVELALTEGAIRTIHGMGYGKRIGCSRRCSALSTKR